MFPKELIKRDQVSKEGYVIRRRTDEKIIRSCAKVVCNESENVVYLHSKSVGVYMHI